MKEDIRKLLPSNIGTKVYISNEARKYNDRKRDFNKMPFKTQNELNRKNNNVFIPSYEGKIYDPTTNKTINFLKKSESQIIKELSKLNSNEKLLKSDAYLNQFNNNPNNLPKDQKLIEEKIKSIEKSKNTYMMNLEEIKNQINILQYNQDKELGILDNTRKSKLNKFIEDCNNKEKTYLLEQKIKKLQEESEKLQLLMKKDLDNKLKKKNDEINNKEKEEEEKRIELLKKIKDKDREYVEKRKKKNTEELLKIKEFIHKKPLNKTYLYQNKKDKHINDENNLVKLETLKRKEIMKHIDLKEFDEMKKNFDIQKSKRIQESNEKMKIIKESWLQRYKLIPLYVNPLSKVLSDEEHKMKQEEQKKILHRKKLKKLQEKYKVPKPQKLTVEKIIEKQNENNLNKVIIRKKPNLIKSNSYSDIIRAKMIEKYKTLQNKREKDKNDELLPDEDYYLDEPQLSQKILENSKKVENNNNKINKSFDKNKNKEKKETFDYLKERRKINELNKEKRRNAGELLNIEYSGTNDIKKLIKDNGINDKMLKVAKCKLESLEEKKRQKDLLLKCSGGVANKPELGEEVCDLMIDSIQAKLSLIKEIDKSLDESINEDDEKGKTGLSMRENTEEDNNDD